MSKKRKSKEAKAAHRNLASDHPNTKQYSDNMPQPEHTQLSTPTQIMDHPARQLPNPQGGNFWGDPNNLTEGM